MISAGTSLKERALAIIERVPQPIDFVLHIAERFIRRFQRTVLDSERGVIALQFLERFQTAPDRSDLPLQDRNLF